MMTMTAPWSTTTEQRKNDFLCSQGKRALYLYEAPDASSFRYRVYNVCQALKQSKLWSAEYFFTSDEQQVIFKLIDHSDVVIICRVRWIPFVDQVVQKAHKLGIPVLFDIDDMIFDEQMIPEIMNCLNVDTRPEYDGEYNMSFWFSHCARMKLTASRADGFLASNAFLAEKLSRQFGKPCRIIRNFMNEEQLTASEKLRNNREEPGEFVIGYFSGSPTHYNDLMSAAPEICTFMERHKDVKLRLVGYMDLPAVFRPFYKEKRIQLHPLVDFLNLQRLISEVSVNIVPLVENDFTNCKSELKYFEAAAVNTLTAAAPTFAYRQAICHGENGFLCQPGQWLDTLEQVYSFSPQEREQRTEAALAHVLKEYSGETVRREIEQSLDSSIQQ